MIHWKNTLALGFLTITCLMNSSCNQEILLPATQVPGEIQAYIDTHFKGQAILHAIEDKDGLSKTYDVALEGNVKLEFNRKKEIIDIESPQKLPDSVVPLKIREYIHSAFPNNTIVGWEIEGRGQQVNLDNHLSVEFSRKGDFIRIDD